ncbi:uncharacterized protein PITG_13746 [Phytophthora infestans T30-4]|uniref:Uncharacterized protein n=1 Tax=Phytophthora infestans (strain T30-4) TaxID=403677 RepID=D0NMP4_PHYIT|nr:uncharacterized protein PITG_13746 [Phytophthora infestans T30-4]EEY61801.1 hypothetical protein PITG_13746 [Phytophthora infestans T30-4]|eukprot:XP_002899441.1 hypothetical protein PITG_13746 [Phytophthora infestans T30-4]
MGGTSSKPAPHRIEPEATGVEIFQDPTPEASQESSAHKRQKAVAPAQSAATHVVRSVMQEQLPHTNESGVNSEGKQVAKEEKQKKKRKKSKREKNKAPPTLQSPQARQQHFQQIQDAYSLDEEAKKPPLSESRSRFFNFESWRKSPQLPSDKSRHSCKNERPADSRESQAVCTIPALGIASRRCG